MHHKAIRSILLVGGLLVGTSAFADGHGPTAEMLANTCAGCHGTYGASVGPASPIIGGITEDYFVTTMQAYKSGERQSTIMTRIAKGYSDDQIEAMGKYFASQPFVRHRQEYDADKARLGKRLHKKYCEKCHEDGGTKSDDGGILAGQWKPYMEYAMVDFKTGRRETEKKMKKKVDELVEDHGDAGLEALIEYYASYR